MCLFSLCMLDKHPWQPDNIAKGRGTNFVNKSCMTNISVMNVISVMDERVALWSLKLFTSQPPWRNNVRGFYLGLSHVTKLSLLFLQWTSVGISPRRTITLGKNYSGFFAFLIRTIREKRSGCKAFLSSSQRKASMLSLKVVVEGATIAAYRTGNCSSSVVCWLRGDDCFFRFSPRRWHDGCSIFPLVHGPVTCRPIDLCCSTVFSCVQDLGWKCGGFSSCWKHVVY